MRLYVFVGHGGPFIELMPFGLKVMSSIPALAATTFCRNKSHLKQVFEETHVEVMAWSHTDICTIEGKA